MEWGDVVAGLKSRPFKADRMQRIARVTLHRERARRRQIDMADSMKTTAAAQAGRVWFITGASTGFGRLLAEQVLKAGGRVIATARNAGGIAELVTEYPETARGRWVSLRWAGCAETVRVLELDVTRPEQMGAVAGGAIASICSGLVTSSSNT